MRSYKDYPTIPLGGSDIAQLMCRSWDNTTIVKMGRDGEYSAHYINEQCDIPAHYTKVAEWDTPYPGTPTWIWIYDDEGRTASIHAEHIAIYRAGEMGILIYAPGGSAK